jgi:hypothetical protein
MLKQTDSCRTSLNRRHCCTAIRMHKNINFSVLIVQYITDCYLSSGLSKSLLHNFNVPSLIYHLNNLSIACNGWRKMLVTVGAKRL